MTLAELSAATGMTKPKLGHVESGRYQQTTEDVGLIAAACGATADETKRLRALATQSDGKTWWSPWAHVAAPWFKNYLGLEGFAESAFVFAPVVLPGLLQTTAYAEAITAASIVVRPDFVNRLVELRRARAARLTGDEPMQYHAVIGEPALQLHVGSPEVRREQLRYLVELAALPNVTLQVLRMQDGPYAALSLGKFDLFHFRNAGPIAYMELLDDAVYVHDSDKIGTYTVVIEDLKRRAYSAEESLGSIAEILE